MLMFKSVMIKVLVSLAALQYRVAFSSGIESFLPTLINIKPIIQMRSTSVRDISSDLIDLKNFTFTIYPQSCGECHNGILITIAVQSYVANFESRKTIRETWGKSRDCIKIVFFVGTTYDNSIMKSVAEESILNNDIVQGNIEDTYRSLPYKHIMALKWVYDYCRLAKYVVKTDGDTIVRLDKLYKLLENDTWGSNGLIAGYIERHEKVLRDKSSNMKTRIVSQKEYKEQFYPSYCWGQFVIYSADVIPRLLERSKTVPYFKIEDIYVTGLLAMNLTGIRHINLILHWYLSRAILSNFSRNDAEKDYVYGPYSLTPDEMRNTWYTILSHEKPVNQLSYRKSFNWFRLIK